MSEGKRPVALFTDHTILVFCNNSTNFEGRSEQQNVKMKAVIGPCEHCFLIKVTLPTCRCIQLLVTEVMFNHLLYDDTIIAI